MASGALDREGRFIVAGQGFHGVLLSSWVLIGSLVFLALRWTMPGIFLGDVA
jgi:hypothetical protein